MDSHIDKQRSYVVTLILMGFGFSAGYYCGWYLALETPWVMWQWDFGGGGA